MKKIMLLYCTRIPEAADSYQTEISWHQIAWWKLGGRHRGGRVQIGGRLHVSATDSVNTRWG